MSWYRFFWQAHKWVGLTVAVFVLLLSVTGFFLLLKKEFAWIQPATRQGSAVPADAPLAFLSVEQAWDHVRAADHPAFRTPGDIDRIDVRPAERVFKFRSTRDHAEIQIDAVTGAVLSTETRTSDFIESLHDGSWFGRPVHDVWMPLVAIGVAFLSLSGVWLWLRPILSRRRRRRLQRARGHRPG